MINNYSKEYITLKDIANELHVSPAHLSRKFKTEMNMTITEYIHKIRIDSAIQLIKLKRYSLLEISEMVGYINYSHFNKWFKRFTGVSPKQFQCTPNFQINNLKIEADSKQNALHIQCICLFNSKKL